MTVRSVYEELRDEILADLAKALPVDIVLLSLRGAMTADEYEDCEGDLLERVTYDIAACPARRLSRCVAGGRKGLD
jgi:microcystin degradation protein MlrC